MKKYLWKVLAVTVAMVFLAGCGNTEAEKDTETEQRTPGMAGTVPAIVDNTEGTSSGQEQNGQEQTDTRSAYERLGIDEAAMEVFRAEVSQDVELPIINVSTGGQGNSFP